MIAIIIACITQKQTRKRVGNGGEEMKKSFSWLYRCISWTLCLALLMPVMAGLPASAAEEELYIRPLAGGAAQVAMSRDHVAVLRSDGTVAATGNNEWGQCNVDRWTGIVKIWAADGVTLGLTEKGELLNTAGTMGGWKDIVEVAAAPVSFASMTVVVGLKADGSAVSMGVNARGLVPLNKDVCNVSGWTDMVQVLVYEGIYGLKADGTVLEAGFPGAEPYEISVSQWSGVQQLVKSDYGIFGLTQEGGVLAQSSAYGCESWDNVVRIIPGSLNSVCGLTADGRLLAGGEVAADCGSMTNLVDAAVGAGRVVGLKDDGTAVFSPEPQGMGRAEQNRWSNIKELVYDPGFSVVAALGYDGSVICASLETLEPFDSCDGWTKMAKLYCEGGLWLGLKKDGTFVSNDLSLDLGSLTAGVVNTRPKEEKMDLVAAGLHHSLYVRSDGKVSGSGQSSLGRLDVEDWTDIVAVAASSHTVGLRADGTVVAVGPNGSGQCNVSQWTDVVDVGAGFLNTIGLTADGTVLIAGGNEYDQMKLAGRQGITDVTAGGSTLYALTNRGAVYYSGSNAYSQSEVETWSGIVAVSAGATHVVGLKSDGTVVAAGNNENGQCEVQEWTDIVALAAGSTYTVGLRSDGTVVHAGSNAFGQKDVEKWTDVELISAGAYHILGLTSDGKILAAGSNGHGQCDVAN